MRTATKSAVAAVFAAGLGLVAAAPAQAVEVTEVSDGTRIADGAAVQGTFTATCTTGNTVFVSLTVTQRVSDGRIAQGSDFEQWTCAEGTVELAYDVVAYTMAFEDGDAVVSGYLQECQAEFCGSGTAMPLRIIQLSTDDGTDNGADDGTDNGADDGTDDGM
ncbi:hypothetical protein GCM10011374_04580 [Kocuria dechangensis]|uniref:Uncharacterized protein n=1 Tax=Kocuria dechangensis TaxID=1176249 RepID=A0A917LN98_9MICC|nr:hypothetical protein [Kocuria dechangensis]GGG45368.1 hypothetical protein GCM10011374_04580 [Kocuria dechangensis]